MHDDRTGSAGGRIAERDYYENCELDLRDQSVRVDFRFCPVCRVKGIFEHETACPECRDRIARYKATQFLAFGVFGFIACMGVISGWLTSLGVEQLRFSALAVLAALMEGIIAAAGYWVFNIWLSDKEL